VVGPSLSIRPRYSESLGARRMGGSGSEACVARDERGAEFLGEPDIDRVEGRQIMPQAPKCVAERENGDRGLRED
jgi:hypothetical protein